ncbi:putative disease resistance RPP13-like protein 1 [Oryza brachyantha]|uniref:putative disease resistance RPP13-like protein 1 n=1 Tax=Oryza brachyantha TaxID=4533 RepID=UPI001ADB106B|nr:putative disease resistance RPP13-like protein 1 [Oryza brachyantha]
MERMIAAFINQDALTSTIDLHVELQSIIEGRRFFLVLDDVWDDIHAIWSNLRRILSKGAPGSVVLVTTQLYDVASFMATTCPVVLDPLESYDLWKLIKHYAFAKPCNYQYAEALELIGINIAAKLHGLPLAAKIIGTLLRSNVDEGHWNRLLESWWWKISNKIVCANIISSLGISYCSLPEYLRQCYLFLSIFPRNYVFEKYKLSQMWIASGFIQPNNISGSQRLEDIAGQWFDELVNLAFLGPSGCKTGFVMHDLVRDFALALSSNEFRGVKTVNDSSQILQYLSIEMDDLNVKLSDFEIKHLKPIMFFADSGQCSSSDVPYKVEERPKSLCILDFSCSKWCAPTSYLGQDTGATIRTINAISRLRHLKYLDLSFTGINILPDSICSLCHLQVLGLRGCKFDKLPGNMNRLINLRHLHASSDTIAQINGIGKLAKLQELHEYRVKAEDGHRITELSKINDLRGSLRISDLEIVTDAEEARVANLDQKVYITALELRWSDALSIDTRPYLSNKTLGCLRPPRYLQDLKLDGYSGFDFPEWVGDMGQLRHVRAVELSSCKNACNLPPLGQLEHLKILKLHRLPGITAIDSKFCGSSDVVFRSLEELSFKDMESWVSWTYEGGRDFIPNLQKLQIRSCKHLRKVPFESLGSATKEILIDCGLYDDTGDMVSRYLQGLNGLSRLELCGYNYQWSGSKLFLPCKQLMSLEYLDIKEFEDVCIIGGLWHIRNLKDLRIIGCNIRIAELDEDKQAPIQIDRVMYSLTHLTLGGTKRHVLPVPENVFPHTPSLRNLRLYGLHSLTSITEKWLQHLTSLQELELSWCHGLPSGLASLSSLNRFILKHCGQIHSIPSSSLPGNLKEMRIEGCSHQLEQHCRNPSDEVWQQQGQRMLYWRNSKIRDWPRAKMHEREDRRHPWFHQERTDQANLWSRKHQVDEQSFSEVENPSSVDAQLEEEEQEWLKEEERKFLATMGKDWPSICHVPYIRVNGRIVQNLYT